jgi:hypothetical protein
MIRRLSLAIVCALMVSAIGVDGVTMASARDRSGAVKQNVERAARASKQGRGKQADRAPTTFRVGPGEQFAKPSEVVASLKSGDTVVIAPGTYEDCVVWPRRIHGLTIEGKDAVITGRTCGGKGLFVVGASDVTIRGLTFQGAKVADHNGAGIRSEGANLTVENSRFIDNENGILAGRNVNSSIIVQDSFFEGNGSCEGSCAHGIYIGAVKSLRVVQCTFVGQHHGHHIKSRALSTDIADSDIRDGAQGDASYLIDIPNGGTVSIRGNRMQKGPHAENSAAAIMIGEDGVKRADWHPTTGVRIENNQFSNEMRVQTNFVRSFLETPITLANNKLTGNVTPLKR